ncbi:MAG: 2-succinyl-6-hydroxy-2,4-cyclohexadiene-1-carboxylate synthase [Ktedonobacterales bacterium]|nr:2-succinyl-6-hydroxy-2,4-cyclohexadiene-1-carboxylate synthase [Ktedonobacterales bacterium]
MSARIAVRGIHLGIEERGDPAAPPLVLLHGFTGSAAGWGSHLEALAAAGYRAIALDMLGHGASDAPPAPLRYRIEDAREDISAVLDNLGIGEHQAILLGYSMGGRIALYLAVYASYFRGLILESASPGIADVAEREVRRMSDNALADRIEHEGVPAFVDYWERLPLFASQHTLPDAVQSEVRAGRLRNNACGLANSLRGIGTGAQPALHQALEKLDIPVLLIAGALDAKYAAIAQEMSAVLPQARLAIVPDAGHTVHLEQPQVFDEQVIEFSNTLTR